VIFSLCYGVQASSWVVGWLVGWWSFSQFVSLLTQWGRVFPELTFTQMVKKFPYFYGNQMFMTVFTEANM
jgi:hypothetical protein